MNKEQRAALRRLAEEATQGERIITREGFSTVYVEARIGVRMLQEVAAFGPCHGGQIEQVANAELCAAANPSAILQLLDYIDTLENDAARLDFIEHEAMLSRTGISFDYARITEDGYVVERGWRMCKWHSIGERKTSIRNAIDAAMQGETE